MQRSKKDFVTAVGDSNTQVTVPQKLLLSHSRLLAQLSPSIDPSSPAAPAAQGPEIHPLEEGKKLPHLVLSQRNGSRKQLCQWLLPSDAVSRAMVVSLAPC